MTFARARARSNIALVKYWGKRDARLNLPATGSISLTLSSMHTTTSVSLDSSLDHDEIITPGTSHSHAFSKRVTEFMDRVRLLTGCHDYARIETENNFPTGAGLASSASGFAALALASTKAMGSELPLQPLADLARQGSGSAPRSLLGGLVEIQPGVSPDGSDFQVNQLLPATSINLCLVVIVTQKTEKVIGSTEGMERTRQTSPYYESWLNANKEDLKAAKVAIERDHFTQLGLVVERSALAMHALAMSARPPVFYWNPVTVALLKKIWQCKDAGLEGFLTIDAGPQVKVLCRPSVALLWKEALSEVQGVEDIWVEHPGEGAELLS